LPDGRLVTASYYYNAAAASYDYNARVWTEDLHDNTWQSVVLRGHTRMVTGVAVLSDGRLVTTSDDQTVRVWGIVE
jgi:WD40 repeat protein